MFVLTRWLKVRTGKYLHVFGKLDCAGFLVDGLIRKVQRSVDYAPRRPHRLHCLLPVHLDFIELVPSVSLLLQVLVLLPFAEQFLLTFLGPLKVLVERFDFLVLLVQFLLEEFLANGTEQVDINQLVVALFVLLLALGNLVQDDRLLEVLQKSPLLLSPLLRILCFLLLGVLVDLLLGENEVEGSFLGRVLLPISNLIMFNVVSLFFD